MMMMMMMMMIVIVVVVTQWESLDKTGINSSQSK
jgi:hypothetical protein